MRPKPLLLRSQTRQSTSWRRSQLKRPPRSGGAFVNVAAIALPLAPADVPEKVAGVGIRLRVQQMHKAWNVFVSGSSPVDGWQMVPPCRCHRCVGRSFLKAFIGVAYKPRCSAALRMFPNRTALWNSPLSLPTRLIIGGL